MCQCFQGEEDSTALPEKAATFVSDRSLGAVTGPRRMGRENLVLYVADAARAAGRTVMVVPGDPVDSPDTIIFMHWRDIDESLVAANPGADVLYGQDLCHQVPSVVRVVKGRARPFVLYGR